MFDSLTEPGMTAVLAIVLILEIASLVVLGIVIVVFRRIQRSQREFFCALYGIDVIPAQPPVPPLRHFWRTWPVMVWIYILLTILIGLVTLSLFVFQPHIL